MRVTAGVDLGGTAVNYTFINGDGQWLIDGLCEHPARAVEGPDICLQQIDDGLTVAAARAGLTRDECISALYATVSAYRSLRSDEASLLRREAAELAAVAYLEQVRTSTILSQERRSSPT